MPTTTLYDSLGRLTQISSREAALPALKPALPIAAKAGRAVVRKSDQKSSGGGGGIASPLTESAAREYHPAQVVYSSDGLFALKITPLKKITFTDADSAEAVFNLNAS